MAILPDILAYMYPGINFRADCLLQDDGAGPYIAKWNTAKLGAQPLQATIDSNAVAAQAALDATAAATAQAGIDKAALKTAYTNAVTRLNQINAAAAPTNAQVIQAVRDMAQIQLQIMNVVKAML